MAGKKSNLSLRAPGDAFRAYLIELENEASHALLVLEAGQVADAQHSLQLSPRTNKASNISIAI